MMAAPKENQNAVKEEGATSFLHVRVTPAEKARWVRAANRTRRRLADWVREKLNGASGQ